MNRTLFAAFGLLAAFSASAQSSGADPEAYSRDLRAKYGARIKYQSDYARRVVETFDIDCQAPDKRVLPLSHVLLAKLAQLDSKDSYLTARVDSRGEDVRIYDELVQGGRVIDSQVSFEINKWGELRSHTARAEAIRNACFGSYGPIWRMPVAARVQSSEPTGDAKRLMDQVATLNSKCRGGSGDSPATVAACADRAKATRQLQTMGWCWGPEDAIGADKRWVRCR